MTDLTEACDELDKLIDSMETPEGIKGRVLSEHYWRGAYDFKKASAEAINRIRAEAVRETIDAHMRGDTYQTLLDRADKMEKGEL